MLAQLGGRQAGRWKIPQQKQVRAKHEHVNFLFATLHSNGTTWYKLESMPQFSCRLSLETLQKMDSLSKLNIDTPPSPDP